MRILPNNHFVRHPGYIGIMVYSLAAPLMFGSWWAYIPAGLLVVVILARTISGASATA
jgi:protein-S-isoprenylcysteine O-methyltransferase Ste14